MEQQPLVSIIVPVYNAKNHIARCIESIRRQTYQNLQIIVLNDGSKDVSLEVCRMYAKVDKRILLVDKANSGVSATRNLGLKLAEGKYLQFADSDDYLDPNATALLVNKAERYNADMVIAHYHRVETVKLFALPGQTPATREITTTFGFLEEGPLDKLQFARHLMEEPASFYYGVMWNKLYRRELVQAHDIQCSEELEWSEDLLFNLEYIRYAERFYALATPIYYYVQNPESICHSWLNIRNMVTTRTALFTYYKDLYESLGLYEENKLQIYKYLVSVAESPRDARVTTIVNNPPEKKEKKS